MRAAANSSRARPEQDRNRLQAFLQVAQESPRRNRGVPYTKAVAMLRDSDTVVAIGYSFNAHDRAGVSKACRYDPDVNPTYQNFAAHYGFGVLLRLG